MPCMVRPWAGHPFPPHRPAFAVPGPAQRLDREFSTNPCDFRELSTHKRHHSKPSSYRINATIGRVKLPHKRHHVQIVRIK